jgi:hypothetical protein
MLTKVSAGSAAASATASAEGSGRGGAASGGGGFSGAAGSIVTRLTREKALKGAFRDGAALWRDMRKGDIKKRQPWSIKETQSVKDSRLGCFFIFFVFFSSFFVEVIFYTS